MMASLGSISLLFCAFSISLQISTSREIQLKPKEAKQEIIFYHVNESSSMGFDPSKVIQLSWHPRAFLYKGFLSDEECEHLISQAQAKLENSLVNGSDTGNNTSSSTKLARSQDEIMWKIEERISAWTFLPKEYGENMQILHYRINESHAPDYDYVNGGNRVARVVMQLSTVARGGEIVFPKSEANDQQVKDAAFSDCASNAPFSMKLAKGDALLIFNLYPNTTFDESSVHSSCPVLEGGKWTATKWIHTKTYNPNQNSTMSSVSDEECTDEDDRCSKWAATGECQRNPVFMLGTPDYYGSCRKSCGAC